MAAQNPSQPLDLSEFGGKVVTPQAPAQPSPLDLSRFGGKVVGTAPDSNTVMIGGKPVNLKTGAGAADAAQAQAHQAGGGVRVAPVSRIPFVAPAGQPDSIDRAIANHPYAQKINKGLEEGVLQGFGLHAPDPNNPASLSMSDIGEQSVHNITEATRHAFHDLGGGNWSTATGVANSVAAAAGTVPYMIGSGIDAVATSIHDGGKELIEGLRTGDPEKASRGFGKILASTSQVMGGAEAGDVTGAGGEAVGDVVGKGTNAAGEAIEDRAPVAGNSLLRATRRENFLYGKNPGKAFVDEKITPPLNPTLQGQLENLHDQFARAGNDLDLQVRQKLQDPNVATKTIDASAQIKQAITETKERLAQQQGVADRARMIQGLDDLQDELLNKYSAAGKVVGSIDKTPLSPVEVSDLKKAIGRSTEWVAKTDPEYAYKQFINSAKKAAYGKLNDAIEQVAPGTRDLNARFSNVIEAQRLLENRLVKEGTNELTLQRALSRGEWLTSIGALMHGLATKNIASAVGGAIGVADRIARSSAGRVIRARVGNTIGTSVQGVAPAISDVAAGSADAAARAGAVSAGANAGRFVWTASDGSIHSAPDTPANRQEVLRIDPQAQFHQ